MSKFCTLVAVLCALGAFWSIAIRDNMAAGACALTGLLWLLLGRIAKQEWPGAD